MFERVEDDVSGKHAQRSWRALSDHFGRRELVTSLRLKSAGTKRTDPGSGRRTLHRGLPFLGASVRAAKSVRRTQRREYNEHQGRHQLTHGGNYRARLTLWPGSSILLMCWSSPGGWPRSLSYSRLSWAISPSAQAGRRRPRRGWRAARTAAPVRCTNRIRPTRRPSELSAKGRPTAAVQLPNAVGRHRRLHRSHPRWP